MDSSPATLALPCWPCPKPQLQLHTGTCAHLRCFEEGPFWGRRDTSSPVRKAASSPRIRPVREVRLETRAQPCGASSLLWSRRSAAPGLQRAQSADGSEAMARVNLQQPPRPLPWSAGAAGSGMVRRPIKQELPSWVKPLCGASERWCPQSAEWCGQPDLLKAVGTPKPGPHRPWGGARLPEGRACLWAARQGTAPPSCAPSDGSGPAGGDPQHRRAVSPPTTRCPVGHPQKLPVSPPAGPAPAVGLLCRAGGRPNDPTSLCRQEVSPRTSRRRAAQNAGWDSPATRRRLTGPGERGAFGGPRGTAGRSPCTEGGRFPQAASERGCACAAHLTVPEAAALRPGVGWGGDVQRSGSAHGGNPGDGPQQVPGVRAMHKAQTVLSTGSGKRPAAPPGHTGQCPPRTGRLDAEQTRLRVRKSSVAADVRPADFRRPRAPPSGFPTSRDPCRGSLAHFGCEGKSSVLGWGALRCPPRH